MTQTEWVLDRLQRGATLTPLSALAGFGIFRLGARIHDLKQEGHDILSQMVTVKNRRGEECHVKAYWMAGRTALLFS